MGGIVSCVDLVGSVTSNSSSGEEITSHSKNVQFHRPANLDVSGETPFYRVLLLGFGATGKTALITRNSKQLFYKNYIPTVVEEISYTTQIVSTKGRREIPVRVQITDLPGFFLRKTYYNNSLRDRIRIHDGIIVAIDSTKSFGEVKEDLEKLLLMVNKCIKEQSGMKKEHCENQGRRKCIIIALTKVDLVSKVQVSIDQVQGILNKSNLNQKFWHDIRLVETSALYGINILVLFQNLVQMCHNSCREGICNLYDFWKNPIMAEGVLDSWGIISVKNDSQMRSNQQKTSKIIPAQQVHWIQKSKTFSIQHDQLHQLNTQMSISSPAIMMHSPEQPLQWMKQDANMCCLTIGHAMLDSCVEDMSPTGSRKRILNKPGLTMVKHPPKPELTLVSNSSEDIIKSSPTNTSLISDEQRDSFDYSGFVLNGIMEHRRSVSSVVSMIEDKDSSKEPESCKDMERRVSSYREKMMEAKEKNQFAVANMYKQEAIKCQLLLSETRNRQDGLTKLLNRNAFDEDIPIFEQVCESKTPGLKGVIFAIDLMNFKLLNDEHGHGHGDQALKKFARALKRGAKKMAKVSGKSWNVYRVGGDEFAITALVSSNDRELFKSAAQNLADIRIPWTTLVGDCASGGMIFARIGGVFGRLAKYEDADIIERNIKERIKHSRKIMTNPEDTKRVMLYYLDVDDRNEIIAEYEDEIERASKMREFSRCSDIQEYIKFLQEGFIALKNDYKLDIKEDEALTRGDTTLYSTNAIKRLTKRSSLQEIYDIEESEGSTSSEKKLANSPPTSVHREETTKKNKDAENWEQIGCGIDIVIKSTPVPPSFQSDSDKDINESQTKPLSAHGARPSRSMSDVSGHSGTLQRIGGYITSSTSDSQGNQNPRNTSKAGHT